MVLTNGQSTFKNIKSLRMMNMKSLDLKKEVVMTKERLFGYVKPPQGDCSKRGQKAQENRREHGLMMVINTLAID